MSIAIIMYFASSSLACAASIVLQAVLALYKVGFPAIGQIHSGNIFMVENRYVLGGYENTLLGYESNLYGKIASGNLLASIDVIMFGRFIKQL